METQVTRYHIIDTIRGITIISMILYHAVWDMVHIYHYNWSWYESNFASIWQLSICVVFILLAGFCWHMSKHQVRRGLTVFLYSIVVSIVTLVMMPEDPILFGILTFLGSAMLIMILLDRCLKKIPSLLGIIFCILFFFIAYPINEHYLNFSFLTFGILPFPFLQMIKLPDFLYTGILANFFGFTEPGFSSADYYSFFPWFFLFCIGYFSYPLLTKNNLFQKSGNFNIKPLSVIGRHSLGIYMLHQPIVYVVLMVARKVGVI